MTRKLIALFIITAFIFLSGCSLIRNIKGNRKILGPQGKNPSSSDNAKDNNTVPPKQSTNGNNENKIQPKTNGTDPVKKQLDSMTLDEKLGQMVITGIDSYTADGNALKMINSYHVGGFIVLSQNVKNTSQLLGLLNSLKKANSKNKIPLFISVDEEGGRISRMPAEFANFPPNSTIGRANNAAFSYKVGVAIAHKIKSFGFNMDFAPVLDINSNPENPVIGDRSFGANANIVTKLGIQTVKGLKSQNVISVVKHFPGHGDTFVDSHIGLPSVNHSLDKLKSFELIPFQESIKNGVDGVMAAHILFPKIDADYPSSMSKSIITGILRNYLKYTGVIITDDMTMGAITKNYDIRSAAVKSVNAGCDIILVCHGHDNEVAVITALKSAVSKGTISKARVDESVYRILSLKRKYNINDNLIGSVDVKKINGEINALLRTLK
ncbi:MAG: beta-N-acetylhexosaminidase [Clostridiales bacterium]|nr:beta-N-acetylhexosaminidase [Clostridiales bacterium]